MIFTLVPTCQRTHTLSIERPNTLDLVFTNEEDKVIDVRHCFPLGKSHHQTFLFSYICCSEEEPPQEQYNCPEGDYAKLVGMLSDENWEELDKPDALNLW